MPLNAFRAVRLGHHSTLQHRGGSRCLIRSLLAISCTFQGKYAEATSLYASAQAVRQETLGPVHPDVAHSLNNRAILLKKKVRAVRNFQGNSCET